MNIRKLDLNKDYHIVEDWWKQRHWTPVAKEALSTIGYIVDDIAAMWLYLSVGSKLAWIGFPIANPNTTKEQRNDAIDLLFNTIHEYAKINGYDFIITTSNIPAVINRIEKIGYIKGDENVSHFWRKL